MDPQWAVFPELSFKATQKGDPSPQEMTSLTNFAQPEVASGAQWPKPSRLLAHRCETWLWLKKVAPMFGPLGWKQRPKLRDPSSLVLSTHLSPDSPSPEPPAVLFFLEKDPFNMSYQRVPFVPLATCLGKMGGESWEGLSPVCSMGLFLMAFDARVVLVDVEIRDPTHALLLFCWFQV